MGCTESKEKVGFHTLVFSPNFSLLGSTGKLQKDILFPGYFYFGLKDVSTGSFCGWQSKSQGSLSWNQCPSWAPGCSFGISMSAMGFQRIPDAHVPLLHGLPNYSFCVS